MIFGNSRYPSLQVAVAVEVVVAAAVAAGLEELVRMQVAVCIKASVEPSVVEHIQSLV